MEFKSPHSTNTARNTPRTCIRFIYVYIEHLKAEEKEKYMYMYSNNKSSISSFNIELQMRHIRHL